MRLIKGGIAKAGSRALLVWFEHTADALVEDVGEVELVWFEDATEARDEVVRKGDGVESGLDAVE